MKTNSTLPKIDFSNADKILTYSVNSIANLKINFSNNNTDKIVFEIQSILFGCKKYRIEKPEYAKEHIVSVLIVYPVHNAVIELIPIENCIIAGNNIIKTEFIGSINDIRGFKKDYTSDSMLPFCNLDNLIINVSLCTLAFNISNKAPSFQHEIIKLNELYSYRDEINDSFINLLGEYNSAYYSLEYNKDKAKQLPLLNNFIDSSKSFYIKTNTIENDIIHKIKAILEQIKSIHLKNESTISLTAPDISETDTPDNIISIQYKDIKQNNHFCSQHPYITVDEVNDDFIPSPIHTWEEDNQIKFQIKPEKSNLIASHKVNLPLPEKALSAMQILNKALTPLNSFKSYHISIKSCGYPDIDNNTDSIPTSELSTTLNVYSSNEYAFIIDNKNKYEQIISRSHELSFKPPLNEYKPTKDYYPANSYFSKNSLPDRQISKYSEINQEKFCCFKEIFKEEKLNDNKAQNQSMCFYVNELKDSLLNSGNTTSDHIYSLIDRIKNCYLNIINPLYPEEIEIQHRLQAFTGYLALQWGAKNIVDHNITLWKKLQADLKVFQNSFALMYKNAWGTETNNIVRGNIEITAQNILTHKEQHEKTIQQDFYRFHKIPSRTNAKANLYMELSDNTVTTCNQVLRKGIHTAAETSYKIQNEENRDFQYDFHFKGLSLLLETKDPVFKTTVYEKNIIEPFPAGQKLKTIKLPEIKLPPFSIQNNLEILYTKTNYYLSQYSGLLFLLLDIKKNLLLNSGMESLDIPLTKDSKFDYPLHIEDSAVSDYTKEWSLLFPNQLSDVIALSSLPDRINKIKNLLAISKTFLNSDNKSELGRKRSNAILLLAYLTDISELKIIEIKNYKNKVKDAVKVMISLEKAMSSIEEADEYKECAGQLTNQVRDLEESGKSILMHTFTPAVKSLFNCMKSTKGLADQHDKISVENILQQSENIKNELALLYNKSNVQTAESSLQKSKYVVAECTAINCTAEFCINNIPIFKITPENNDSVSIPVNHYLKSSKNRYNINILPDTKQKEINRSYIKPNKGEYVSMKIALYNGNDVVGRSSSKELAFIEWPLKYITAQIIKINDELIGRPLVAVSHNKLNIDINKRNNIYESDIILDNSDIQYKKNDIADLKIYIFDTYKKAYRGKVLSVKNTELPLKAIPQKQQNDYKATELPINISKNFKIPFSITTKFWSKSKKLKLNNKTIQSAITFIEGIHNDISKGLGESFVEKSKFRILDNANSYNLNEKNIVKSILNKFPVEAELEPLDLEKLKFKLHADKRLLHITNSDNTPILKEKTNDVTNYAYYDIFIGKLKGKWNILL